MKEVDITTIIGCPNACSYCPQDTFMNKYDGIKILTLGKFKEMLNNIRKDTIINIAGYSENFYNENLADMLIYAHESGYKLRLYTTLRGFTNRIIEKLSGKVEFDLVNFHEYDGLSFNKEVFDSNVKKFRDNIKINTCIIKPVKKIHTRASNLNGTNIERKLGWIKCTFAGCNLLWDCNQILPNGDIYLCCMDWSLNHKIGNIFDHHYNWNELNEKRLELESLMMQHDSDIICRKCEFAKHANV